MLDRKTTGDGPRVPATVRIRVQPQSTLNRSPTVIP